MTGTSACQPSISSVDSLVFARGVDQLGLPPAKSRPADTKPCSQRLDQWSHIQRPLSWHGARGHLKAFHSPP